MRVYIMVGKIYSPLLKHMICLERPSATTEWSPIIHGLDILPRADLIGLQCDKLCKTQITKIFFNVGFPFYMVII